LALVGLGIVIGAIVVLSRPEREPEYGGKKLSEWVREFRTPTRSWEADVAIRHLGTNALPYLIKWMSYELAPWKVKVYNGLPNFLRRPFNSWIQKDLLATAAARAFENAVDNLGPDARPVAPVLIKLMNDPKRKQSAGRAAMAIGHLGDEFLPALTAALTNRSSIRSYVVSGIGSMGTNAWPAAPALTNLLDDPDPVLRQLAAGWLRRIDPGNVRTNELHN